MALRHRSAERLATLAAAALAACLLGAPRWAPALTAQSPSKDPGVRFVPDDLEDTAWLERLHRQQVKAAAGTGVFHDFQFTDRLEESGITFRHRIVDDAGRTYKAAHYDHGNGLAIADVDGDGLLDIYFVNQVGGNELWRNLGGGRFENITERAGVAVADRISVSASFADVDNDGAPDLYVTTVRGGNILFKNDGTGRFRDITAAAGLEYVGHSSSAVFFDDDRDGLLDLFLVNVGRYTTDTVAGDDHEYYVAYEDAFSGHLMPERAERSILYRNVGGSRFIDVSEQVGLVDVSWSGDATVIDVNDDGWPDLYIVNMQGDDEYYENVGGKKFVRRSRQVFPRTSWGAMGVKVFDFDNDGQLDLRQVVTEGAVTEEHGVLYLAEVLHRDAAAAWRRVVLVHLDVLDRRVRARIHLDAAAVDVEERGLPDVVRLDGRPLAAAGREVPGTGDPEAPQHRLSRHAVAEVDDVIHDGRVARSPLIGHIGIGRGEDHIPDGLERDAVVPRVEPDERLTCRAWTVGAGVDVHVLVDGVAGGSLERVLDLRAGKHPIGARRRIEAHAARAGGSPALGPGSGCRQRGRRQHRAEKGPAMMRTP